MVNFGLKKIKRPIKVYKIASFDIETYGYENLFLLGGYYSDRYYSFLDKSEMRQFIANQDIDIVYATNLGFDFEALYYRCYNYSDRKALYRNGMLTAVTIDSISFGDTLSYTKSSVKALGRMLGIPKMYKPKFLGMKYKNKRQLGYLKRYNSRDCLVTKTFMEQFQKVLNELGGELKITIGSCAMDLYRRKYIPETIYKERFDCKDFIMKAYYGGRTECFKRGGVKQNNKKNKTIYYLYDVNSLYPSVMTKEYPLPSSACKVIPSIENIKKCGVSEVTITAPNIYYPLLPYRKDNKLLFPIGTFKGVYNHIELEKAISLGYTIKKIHKQIIYTKGFFPFKEWVCDLYAKRLEYAKQDNGIYVQIIKMLLNSLYGKFATSKLTKFEDINYIDGNTTLEQTTGAYMDEKGYGYKETPIDCNQNYVIPILASYTTSYARIVLYDYLTELNGIYCDTDSIITTTKIESSKELGKLKLEKVFTNFNIVKPKHYMILNDLDNKYYVKIKGVRLSEKPLNDFYKSIDDKDILQIKFSKFKESYRRRIKPNTKIEMVKRLSVIDNKRIWYKEYTDKELIDSKPIEIR